MNTDLTSAVTTTASTLSLLYLPTSSFHTQQECNHFNTTEKCLPGV